jgi:tetratricopeptide (TPR) repeat protein
VSEPATKSQSASGRTPALVVPGPSCHASLLPILLVLGTLALYWPALRFNFINYDDPDYVTANLQVQSGLSWESVKWAFFNPVAANWHPLTMMSHMLDCQFYGLKPWGHHLTSVLLHALNAALVFLLLRQTTGARWRSFLVALFFSVHPLRIQSVAWIAERKDILSGCFGLLALIFYARYAQRKIANRQIASPTLPAQPGWLIADYLLALGCYALGLMSKSMLVTWPFVMLLLDYWPLHRLGNSGFGIRNCKMLVVEKIPFFALATTASVATFVVQQHAGAMLTGEDIPFGARSGNALISYCRYLGKLFWPSDLAILYPHPGYWPLVNVVLAGGLVLGLSALLFMRQRWQPYLLMGWLWYCGTLVPVIGLVQVGAQAMADRYTYLPSVGVLIFVVWGANELARRRREMGITIAVAGTTAFILCLELTRRQLDYWRDSETLFRHALAVTENNYLAHNNLGITLEVKGQTGEAIRQFQEALRLRPDDDVIHNNLGAAFAKLGQTEEAIAQYQETLRLNLDNVQAHYNLGTIRFKQGQIDGAIAQFKTALRLKPDDPEFHYNLGAALALEGQMDEAIRHFQAAFRLKPDYAEAHYNLALAFASKGQTDEAIGQYQTALRLKPDYAEAHNNLGAALGRKGRLDEAINQFQAAIRLQPDYLQARNNLSQALEMKQVPASR